MAQTRHRHKLLINERHRSRSGNPCKNAIALIIDLQSMRLRFVPIPWGRFGAAALTGRRDQPRRILRGRGSTFESRHPCRRALATKAVRRTMVRDDDRAPADRSSPRRGVQREADWLANRTKGSSESARVYSADSAGQWRCCRRHFRLAARIDFARHKHILACQPPGWISCRAKWPLNRLSLCATFRARC